MSHIVPNPPYYSVNGRVFDSMTELEELEGFHAGITYEQLVLIVNRNLSMDTEESIGRAAVILDSDGNPTGLLIDLLHELVELRQTTGRVINFND